MHILSIVFKLLVTIMAVVVILALIIFFIASIAWQIKEKAEEKKKTENKSADYPINNQISPFQKELSLSTPDPSQDRSSILFAACELSRESLPICLQNPALLAEVDRIHKCLVELSEIEDERIQNFQRQVVSYYIPTTQKILSVCDAASDSDHIQNKAISGLRMIADALEKGIENYHETVKHDKLMELKAEIKAIEAKISADQFSLLNLRKKAEEISSETIHGPSNHD